VSLNTPFKQKATSTDFAMGGDGGSFVKRSELVKAKKEAEKLDPALAASAKWTRCAITQDELRAPIVHDELGNLYNKISVLEKHLLLPKEQQFHRYQHITSSKHVFELKVQYAVADDAGAGDNGGGGGGGDAKAAMTGAGGTAAATRFFQCPVASIPADGRHRFVAMRACGCLVSERALKAVPSTTCIVCHGAVAAGAANAADAAAHTVLNPPAAEQDDMRTALLAARRDAHVARQQAKEAKKAAKRRAKAAADLGAPSSSSSSSSSSSTSSAAADAKSIKRKRDSTSSKATAKRPAKAAKAASSAAATATTAPTAAAAAREGFDWKNETFKSLFLTQEQVEHRPANDICSRSGGFM
jgi:hypothetical protein